MERSMRFWKERKKIRLSGFGKLDGFLGNGIVQCAASAFADGDSTAEESLRGMPRIIIPYRLQATKAFRGCVPQVLIRRRERQPFLGLFDATFT